jgi:hypothetical protein
MSTSGPYHAVAIKEDMPCLTPRVVDFCPKYDDQQSRLRVGDDVTGINTLLLSGQGLRDTTDDPECGERAKLIAANWWFGAKSAPKWNFGFLPR